MAVQAGFGSGPGVRPRASTRSCDRDSPRWHGRASRSSLCAQSEVVTMRRAERARLTGPVTEAPAARAPAHVGCRAPRTSAPGPQAPRRCRGRPRRADPLPERASPDRSGAPRARRREACRARCAACGYSCFRRTRPRRLGSQIVDKRPIVRGNGGEGAAVNIDGTGQFGHWWRFSRVSGGLQSCQ